MNQKLDNKMVKTGDAYLYDFIPAHICNRHEPTILYGLEPIGIGTPFVESLSSYLGRLAAAHMLPVSALLRNVIANYLPKDNHNLGKGIGPQAIIKNMNGMGDAASYLVEVLEKLSGRTNLATLTMIPFSKLISPRRLMSSVSSWCPHCLEERKAMEQPVYFPLIWSLKDSKKCPVHRCTLSSACPHCHAISPVLASRTVMGYCHRCTGWLGYAPSAKSRMKCIDSKNFFIRLFEWQYAVDVIRQQSTFPSMLKYLMGNKMKVADVASIAKLLRIDDSIIHLLLTGAMLPALGVVFWISKIFKIDSMDILTMSGEEMSFRDSVTIAHIRLPGTQSQQSLQPPRAASALS